MSNKLNQIIELFDFDQITSDRKNQLAPIIEFIQTKKNKSEDINLNFICTHNSRRSQFSQVWAKVASIYYETPITSYSGGVEVTEVNPRAIESFIRFGFIVDKTGESNPVYIIKHGESSIDIELFSKLFDDAYNAKKPFAAIMSCGHADENCPFIPDAEVRLPMRFNDPKKFDGSFLESTMYDARSFEIGQEMFYIFSKIS